MIALEVTAFEARSLLSRLGPDGGPSMTADQCLAVEVFRKKLDQALKVETGPGGSEAKPAREASR